MRSTVVPAQVTTIEDRVAGTLGLTQLLLLVGPLFGGCAVFMALPPFFNYTVCKMAIIVGLAILCGSLAIRVREQILLWWLIMIIRYESRPRYYLYDKNDGFMRDSTSRVKAGGVSDMKKKSQAIPNSPQLSVVQRMKVEDLMADPRANLHFKANQKGEISVYITEVE